MSMEESMLHSMPEMAEDDKHYPMLHIDADQPLDLPKDGVMTIRYKKVSRAEHEDAEGDTKYSCDIQVHEIIDAYSDEPEAPARSHNRDTENALDGLRESKRKSRY